jgi:hypothetical protein
MFEVFIIVLTKGAKTMIGSVFGRLTVIRLLSPSKSRHPLCECLCECGKTTPPVRIYSLRDGTTKSCGCLLSEQTAIRSTKHGFSGTSEYNSWHAMIGRCTNENDIGYANYGGRGITVCDRWLDINNFIADMGLKPTPKHQLDRKENNGNYEPGNCKWSTNTENMRNTRSNHLVTVLGETLCMTEMGAKYGVSIEIVNYRTKRGWTIEKAFITPVRKYTKH